MLLGGIIKTPDSAWHSLLCSSLLSCSTFAVFHFLFPSYLFNVFSLSSSPQELQCLERSNSALQKEIAALKKDLHLYTTALEHHEPHCCLREPAFSSSSSTPHLASPSVGCRTGSSLPGVAPQASNSSLLAAPSLSTSLNSSPGLQTLDYVENTHISPSTSAPTTTTLASSCGSSTDLFITSSPSPMTVPCSLSFSTLLSPHSLFSKEPVITSGLTTIPPVRTGLAPDHVPSSPLNVAAHPQSVQDAIRETSSLSADACFSALNSDTLEAFLTIQNSYITASSNAVPPYYNVAGGCHMNTGLYSDSSAQSCSLLPPTLQDAALQSFSVSPQARLEPTPAPAFALKSSSSQQMTPNPAPLLSLLTVPSPLNFPRPTSNSFDRSTPQPPPSLPQLVDGSRDVSLSELLEVNDWILSGANSQ